jgi:hypothetical protein
VGERLAIHLQIRFLFIFQRVSGQRKGDTKRLRAVLLEHVLGFGHALALGFECHRGAGSALGHDADAARNAERVIDLPIFLVVDQIPGLVVELLVVALGEYLLAIIQRRQMLLARIDRAASGGVRNRLVIRRDCGLAVAHRRARLPGGDIHAAVGGALPGADQPDQRAVIVPAITPVFAAVAAVLLPLNAAVVAATIRPTAARARVLLVVFVAISLTSLPSRGTFGCFRNQNVYLGVQYFDP